MEPFEGGLVLTLSGELDAYDAPALRAAFAEAAADGERDGRRARPHAVSFLDSTALGTIVGLLRRVRERGGELRVVLPETEARRIFELTSLDRSLDVRPRSRERPPRLTAQADRSFVSRTMVPAAPVGRPVDREVVDDGADDREAHPRLDRLLADADVVRNTRRATSPGRRPRRSPRSRRT